ncbi:MAG: (deoxy)nucleoside triphosphate pyrophosphohydrolase [Proteobacteria bacterium]|nr:(deoxy)nucleoside triphosphate pyrophosphohydrolase [Pseudomonadota bacterium]
MTKPIIHAAAVALVDRDKRVLIAERPQGKYMAGYWEFPGGKLEEGETPEQALKREVMEELGISLGCTAPLTFISETREDHHVIVYVYVSREWKGIPENKIHTRLAWTRIGSLKDYNLLPSNIPLIANLRDTIGL